MKKKMKQFVAASMIMSMTTGTISSVAAPIMPVATASDAVAAVQVDIPKGTLVLNGLFDVKSLEAGISKYLYINTYPEKGTEITEVKSSDENVVKVSHGNNSAGMAEDDTSGKNENYNYVQLDAIQAGNATISVTVTDTTGKLGSVTEEFTVQVIPPEYAGTQRTITDFSQDWKFCLERDMTATPESGQVPAVDEQWEDVTIPHCWNTDDGADGGNNYHKGIGWYVREISPEELTEALGNGTQIYLEMGAACKVSEIYVNGTKLAHHEGGYSRIRVDLADALQMGQTNTIAISVDNRVNGLTPMSGDFTVFGGLYRDISLVSVGDIHMDLDQKTSYGGRGLYISQQGTEGVTKDTTVEDVFGTGGKLTVAGEIENSDDESQKVKARTTVYDAEWNLVANKDFDLVELQPGAYYKFETDLIVDDPHLWNGTKDPYQYNVQFELLSEDGTVLDRERDRIGFRFFCSDPNEGFFLNGESYPLRGVNSHQDRYNRGYAATHQDREQDMALMDEIGVNTIRFAHYQHDPFVYELAAERGITVWAEIPMVNSIVNSREFYESTDNNLKELIHQAYNIPSVLMWGIHNEQWPNNKGITVLLDQLYKTCKAEDPSRLVTVATAQDPGDNVSESNWDSITLSWQSDVSAWNKYFGLYQGKDARYFGNWMNQVYQYGQKHKTIYGTDNAITNPEGEKENISVYVHGNVGMSEYGAEGNPYIHDEQPGYSQNESNLSEEWQALFHEIYYKVISESPWMWGSYIWNMFEFGSDGRGNAGRQGTNNKGIVSYDRTIKKDSFYFYKANWSDEPTLQITSKRFENRNQDDISVKVYSNMQDVELFVDGVSQGKLTAGSKNESPLNNQGKPDETLLPNTQLGKFVWDVKLEGQGAHQVVAVGTDKDGKVYTDTVTWNRKLFEEPEISSSKYNVNSASHTISGVPGGTTVETMVENLTPVKNSTFEFYTEDKVLIEDRTILVQLGMIVRVTAEDGIHTADYVITSQPVSQGKAATAIADQDGKYPAKNAVDGDSNSRWGSGGSFPGWIQIDLGDVYTLDTLDTLWYNSSGRKYEFEVQGSLDGTSFETMIPSTWSVQGDIEPTWTPQTFEDDAQARYLKLHITGNTGSPSIYEIQANGFRLTSDTYGINNADRVIIGVEQGTTEEDLLSALAVEGNYNTIEIQQTEDDMVTSDSIVVVGYGDGREVTYIMTTSGPDSRPISQGKSAVALEIEVGGEMIPNEDTGAGCNLGNHHDVASKLVDGDLQTRWTGALTESGHTIPSNAYPAEVLIDLEQEYELNDLFISTYDPSTRIYQFVVYAGNDPETIKSPENIVLDMRENKDFANGNKPISGRAQYLLLSVEGNTAPSSYRAASFYEMSVYGYRFNGDIYTVDQENHAISGVEVQATVEEFLNNLDIQGNYMAKVVLGEKVLADNDQITPGVELQISGLDGKNPVTYAMNLDEVQTDIPVSQNMEVYAHDVETDHGTIPNEDAEKGDYAYKINDGDDTTRWVGAFDAAHINCYYPASVTVNMTDLQDTSEYYYLTGVKVHFYEGSDKRSYKYRISAKNIVGIETGFEVNAEDNTTSGWVEHWTEEGSNEIKDLTLIVTECSNKNSYAAASVHELQVFAWRVLGHDFKIDETNKKIYLGDQAFTLSELRNDLEILGNCTVTFVNADGKELGWNDLFGEGCKMIVTDVKGHEFIYQAEGGEAPEVPDDDDYETTSIKVAQKPDKMKYTAGEEFDPTGMVVEANQQLKATPSDAEYLMDDMEATPSDAAVFTEEKESSKEATRTVVIPNDQLRYEYDFSENGKQLVTIIYEEEYENGESQEFTTTLEVKVEGSEEDEYYTQKIKVDKKPDKLVYKIGEEFNPTGMVVKAEQKAVPSGVSREITIPLNELDYEYDFSDPGQKEVKMLYYGEDKNFEPKVFAAKVKVNVAAETEEGVYTQSIKVTKLPNKLSYMVGESIDTEGMFVEAVLVHEETGETTTELIAEYTVAPGVFMVPGSQKVTVSYTAIGKNGKPEVFKDSFVVLVQKESHWDDDDDDNVFTPDPSVPQSGGLRAVSGTWTQQADGSWHFQTQGKECRNEWVFAMNTYADPVTGQHTADWFRFDENGNMVTGWFMDENGIWYYMSEESNGTLGYMVTGWHLIQDKSGQEHWYYFNEASDGSKGKLLVNTTTPDGYRVDENGCWIQ